MAAQRDRAYLATCARLASVLQLSSATARLRVEQLAAREGVRDPAGRQAIAERLLAAAEAEDGATGRLLEAQLPPLASESSFLDED